MSRKGRDGARRALLLGLIKMQDDLSKYFALLSRWNKSIRLVSSAESEEEFRTKHVRDALELSPFLSGIRTLIDIGTGAGLPGILIKILRPEIEVTLLDSIRKKISFCDEAIRTLGLVGIRAVTGRAEDDNTMKSLGKFDAIVSRATWGLNKYLIISIPYLAEGPAAGIYALKGAKSAEELLYAKKTIEKQRLKLVIDHPYSVGHLSRHILGFKRR